MAAHRYWKLKIYIANDVNIIAQEIEFRSTSGGADETTPSTTVTGSAGSFSPSEGPDKAIDDNVATFWQPAAPAVTATTTPAEIVVDFGAGNEKEINEISWRDHASFHVRTPNVMSIESSDDDATYTVEWWAFWGTWSTQTRVTTRPNIPGAARYWAIGNLVSQKGSTDVMSAAEIDFYERGVNVTSGGTGFGSPGSNIANAFNNNAANYWNSSARSGSRPYIGYDFGSGITRDIDEVRWQARADGFADQSIVSGDLMKSSDGVSFIPVWSISGPGSWSTGAIQAFFKPEGSPTFIYTASVTVPSGKVASDLTAFPLYIDLSDFPETLWSGAKPDAGDLRVFASDGTTPLAFDLVAYDPESQGGSLFVRTNLATASDTTVIVKWGNADLYQLPVNHTYGRNAVWADYRVVSMFGRDCRDRTGNTSGETAGDAHSFALDGTVATLAEDPHQGGVWDGTHHYLIDDNAIYKYDATWTLVDSNLDPIGDTGLIATTSPDVNHCGDPTYHDGKLYIPVEYYLNATTFSGQHIAVFDASDLSFIAAYDISAQAREVASLTYCDRDGHLYAIGYETNRQLIDKYSLTGIFIGSLSVTQASGARTFTQAQSICWFKNAFWVVVDDADEVIRIEYDGLNQPTNGYFGDAFTSGATEGLWAVGDSLYLLKDPDSADSFVEKWTPLDLPLMAGGGFNNLGSASTTSHASFPLTGEYSTFTMGVSGRITDKTVSNKTILTYYDHVGGGAGNDRTSIAYRVADTTFGVWDEVNLWLLPSVDFDPLTTDYFRIAVVYNGSTNRILYGNGAAIGTSGAITARTGFSALNVGRDDADNGEKFNGYFGYAFLRNSVLSADWMAADYANLNDPSNFYTVTSDDVISSIVPNFGSVSGNVPVTIHGTGFTDATGVLFDTDSATAFVVVDDTEITCETPAHVSGVVDVTVERPTTDIIAENAFTYTEDDPPTFVSIVPDYGVTTGGTSVTITGTNLTGTTDVRFGGVSATSIVVVNSTTITCTTPAHASGAVDLEIFHPLDDLLIEDAFTYVAEARVTQLPVLVVHRPIQPARVTQIPALVLHVPIQGARVTQLPILPVWTPTPIPLPSPVVPEVPVKEVWQWKTVVNIFEGSREQRSALRGGPRMSMQFDALVLNSEDYRDTYEMMLKYISRTFNYPMYVYSAKLTAAASAGATVLSFNPASTDLRDGEVAALFDPLLETTRYVTISTVDVGGATLTEPLTYDVPEYFYICPAPKFKVVAPQFQMLSIAGDFSMSLEGAQVRDVLRPDQANAPTMLGGMLLLDARPLANDKVTNSFDQDIVWLDNEIADPEPKTSWYAPFISGERKFLIHRPGGFDTWRAIANYMNGRQNPFLMPTFRNDLPVIETPALGATEFKTDSIQFFDVWRSKAWKYLRIQSDAGVLYRRINEVLANYDLSGQPISLTVKLSSSIGATAGSNSNMVVSFVNTCRLDSDEIVIDHYETDSILTLKVRTVEE